MIQIWFFPCYLNLLIYRFLCHLFPSLLNLLKKLGYFFFFVLVRIFGCVVCVYLCIWTCVPVCAHAEAREDTWWCTLLLLSI